MRDGLWLLLGVLAVAGIISVVFADIVVNMMERG